MKASVVICTHNCPPERLWAVVETVRTQDVTDLEIIIVDNASRPPVLSPEHVGSDSRLRTVVENELGLTPARLRGAREAKSDIIVFVDDDNFLSPSYVRLGLQHFSDPAVGIVGGRSHPQFMGERPAWLAALSYEPGCNNSGDELLRAHWRNTPKSERRYPAFAPIGTGMMIRRTILEDYATQVSHDPARRMLDRRGRSLASGGDNDIVLTALDAGYEVIYDPEMDLRHQIPAGRLTTEYVVRYEYETNLTWVQVLACHGISPWPPIPAWTAPLRKARAWLRMRPWRDPTSAAAFAGACGQIDGRARISRP